MVEVKRHRSFLALAAMMVAGAGSLGAESLDGTYADGGLEVRLRVSHLGIRTADRIAVILEARAPAGSVLEMPDFAERMGEFRVRDERPGQLRIRPDSGQVEQIASWVLEPYLPGTYTIPALEVKSRPGAAAIGESGESGESFAVQSPPVSVQVTSMFPVAEQKSPTLRDAAEPMREHTPWLPILILLLLAPPGVAMVLRFLRREREGNPVDADAQEAADVAALAALDEMGETTSAGGIQEILNGYLRGRFHQRTRGHSLEEVSKKLPLEGEAKAIFGGLVDELHRARYGRAEQAVGAVATAGNLLREFIRETGVKGGEQRS